MTTAPTLDISEARNQIAHLSARLRDEHVIWITKHNKKVFAAVDADMMEALIETIEILRDPEALRMLQASFEDIRMGNLHDHEDVKKELLQ
jgi:prevent-host-death family protein